MAESAPSRRTVALVVGVALVVIGSVLAAFTVFGGSDSSTTAPDTPPTSEQSADPSTPPVSTPPMPPDPTGTACSIFDPECDSGSTTGGTMPTPTAVPSDGDGGTSGSGNGGLFGGTAA
ncbi:hypothetical protein [Streptomyces sp. 11x1]|uniref:hypothetical protein n=1 Tax=Streptomyces sp. 11x1 TaxID=3038642 RepID=UPI00292D100B|nr:hypothetical protein [Streptomyces sp. 11x1]WNZ14917.1 hypothetical protein P8T65_46625 [Streptomyces sp. 11x1]